MRPLLVPMDRRSESPPCIDAMLSMSTPSGGELDWLRADLAALTQERDALLRQRALLFHSLELYERDRQLLAFEIHDGIVQDVSAAVMLLDSAGRDVSFAAPAAEEAFTKAVGTLRDSLVEARRFIRGLIPVVPDPAGLVASLQKLIEKLENGHGLQVQFTSQVQVTHVAPAFELIVLRIVQESLNNVWRHSGVLAAEVLVEEQGSELWLTIIDKGRGFDSASVPPTRFGLTGIQERARLLGGAATIHSQPGVGTTVVVRLPLGEALVSE